MKFHFSPHKEKKMVLSTSMIITLCVSLFSVVILVIIITRSFMTRTQKTPSAVVPAIGEKKKCPFCKDTYDEVDSEYILTNCGHSVGKCCMSIYIMKVVWVTCPLCRENINMSDILKLTTPDEACIRRTTRNTG
jgi:hypothetical protein